MIRVDDWPTVRYLFSGPRPQQRIAVSSPLSPCVSPARLLSPHLALASLTLYFATPWAPSIFLGCLTPVLHSETSGIANSRSGSFVERARFSRDKAREFFTPVSFSLRFSWRFFMLPWHPFDPTNGGGFGNRCFSPYPFTSVFSPPSQFSFFSTFRVLPVL